MYSKHFRCLPSLPVEINKEDVLTRLQRRLFSRSERAGMGKGIEASWQRLCYCNVSIELVLYMLFSSFCQGYLITHPQDTSCVLNQSSVSVTLQGWGAVAFTGLWMSIPTPWFGWMPGARILIWMPRSCLSTLIILLGSHLQNRCQVDAWGRRPVGPHPYLHANAMMR